MSTAQLTEWVCDGNASHTADLGHAITKRGDLPAGWRVVTVHPTGAELHYCPDCWPTCVTLPGYDEHPPISGRDERKGGV